MTKHDELLAPYRMAVLTLQTLFWIQSTCISTLHLINIGFRIHSYEVKSYYSSTVLYIIQLYNKIAKSTFVIDIQVIIHLSIVPMNIFIVDWDSEYTSMIEKLSKKAIFGNVQLAFGISYWKSISIDVVTLTLLFVLRVTPS